MADYKDLLSRPQVRRVLDFVGKKESPGGSYDVVFGGADEGISKMTVQEVLDWQTALRNDPSFDYRKDSTAVGRYQFMRDTLKDIVDKNPRDFPRDALFDETLQDRAAALLLYRKGWGKGRNLSPYDKAEDLSEIWASIPDPSTNKTRYPDDLNKSLVDVQHVLDILGK